MQYPTQSTTSGLYDALIIGAGPAGASAAALMSTAGRKVLVLERSSFPREKLCGEFISPECFSVFERLGVTDEIRAAGAVNIERMDLIAPNGTRIGIPSRWFPGGLDGAIGLTRARLDDILMASARRSGAEVIEEVTATSIERENEEFVVTAKDQELRTRRFRARLLIDASGRGQNPGFPQASRQPAPGKRRWFAAKVHLRNVKGIGSNGELYFFDGGYGGLTAVEADAEGPRFNLCFLTTEKKFRQAKGDRTRLLESTLMLNPIAKERLADTTVCGDWLGAGPLVYGKHARREGVTSIGDSGAFIDPFTGSGILLALNSAEMLASAVAEQGDTIRADAVSERYAELFLAGTRWRFGVAALVRKMAFTAPVRRVMVPLLASHSGLTRLLAVATRDEARRVVLSDKRMT